VTSPIPAESKADIDAIVETIIYLYTESRRLTKGMASQFGLTGPQLTVIKLLESFGDISLSSLSERIRAQNSTVTGIIDRMEREGLVRRERSTSDRRVVYIRLSEKGARLARQIEVEPMEIFRGALSSLTRDDVRELLRILTKMQKRVRARVSAQGLAPAPGKPGAAGKPAADPAAPDATKDAAATNAVDESTDAISPESGRANLEEP
jgi:DNA-binding MarR family transcriptional regulator